ncbi:ATPase, T2SS/T4P/T4SS family [Thermodesulfobacteriota bacterium]
MDIKTDMESRIKEADVYLSMGLPRESLELYQHILSDIPDQDNDSRETIQEKISLIETEIVNLDEVESGKLSSENVASIQKTLSVVDVNAPAIFDSAFAFKELGLFSEAISEYGKLFGLNYHNERIIPEISECLFKVYPSIQIVGQVENIINNHSFKNEKIAQIKYEFGLEMERRENQEQALYFYETAIQLDPLNEDIKGRLDSLEAHFATGSKYDYLLKNGMVTTDKLQEAFELSREKKKSVEYILIENFNIDNEAVGKSISECYRYPFRGFDPDLAAPLELLGNLKKSFLLQDLWVPLGWEKEGIEILINDPLDLNKIDIAKALLKAKKTKFYVGIKEDIEKFINHFFEGKESGELDRPEDTIDEYDVIPDISFEEEEEDLEDESDQLDEASGKVVKLVDQILVAAYRKNTSDIHIEPSVVTKTTGIRFRMDGVCHEYLQVPNSMAKGILSRIKIMAGLDIAERRLPQDGKIKFRRKGITPFELRVATLPTAGGYEDAVLRILAKAGAMKLEEMGLIERNQIIMENIISQPYGLVLVVGPTGSGKTTSLHAALGHINKPGAKIWTAEDPIEITQQGLRQVEAKPKIGLDFSRIMRAFLRADPDIIMIGEMRDQETAATGVEASLTGHLVFSTLHTNSAPETVTRLLDMGLNPLNFSDAFLGVMAQRLVRRLCSKCREEYHPSQEEFDEVVSIYGEKYFKQTGIELTPDFTLYRASGCDTCSQTGYKGRLGIHELMEGTPIIKRMIKKAVSSEELFEQSMKDGMITLTQDGILKSFQGLTAIDEIRRVCVT